MPVYTDQDPLNMEKWLPKTRQSIPLHTLTEQSECAGKYVKGKVVFKGPLLHIGNHLKYLLKSVIQEDVPKQSQASNNISINVVLFGGLAKDFSHAVNQGDTVVLSGFTVSPSPTFMKDQLHHCNLHLDGTEANVHVCAATAPTVGTSGASATVLSAPAKYVYVPLNTLKHGSQVNVYGVVTFFKLPFPTKGTDYCSTLKLTDPSGATVSCTIFCENQENHPKIFKAGDVIRLHRVKAQMFGGSMTLVTCWGWSALTFDGTVGSPVVPRTDKSFHFSEEDRHRVMELRKWAAHELSVLREPTVPLSAVVPRQYFDFTCQLLAKACLDSACTLLKVWDGTRCRYPFPTIPVEPGTLEGEIPAGTNTQNLIADVLVYDNHVEVAQALKPGMFLCIYNLHAVPQMVAGEACTVQEVLSFHLHGGTSYGRGLCALPTSSPDVSKLQRALQSCAEQMEGDMDSSWDDLTWCTASQLSNGVIGECPTVRKCTHTLQKVSLAHVKSSSPPEMFHVKAQVKSYQPKRLYQCLKLFCSQCKTIEEIPDPETLRARFGQAVRDTRPCRAAWADSLTTDTEDPSRQITLHVSSKSPADSDPKLIFVQGASFDDICHLSSDEEFMIPVKSSRGKLAFLDSMVPFLFRGKRQFYGCRQCSVRKFVKSVEGLEEGNEKSISEALGLQLMEYVLVMKFELDDGTATLEALLLEDSKDNFFHVSADDLSHSQEAQEKMQKIMDSLHPPDGSTLQCPWLELCLSLYAVGENGKSEVHCQIVNTQIKESPVDR
ncbi:protection of telomeres protein 1 isoform X1 [Alosa alosa]|nr:protection of telomeres protein 1 isoform X1 [Alosa alosa]